MNKQETFIVMWISNLVGGIPIPPKNMSSSVGMMKFLKYGKSFKIPWKPVSTKQQVIFWIFSQKFQTGELRACSFTRWCPSSLAKLVNISPISLRVMGVISIVTGDYKPTYNGGGAPPCMILPLDGCHRWWTPARATPLRAAAHMSLKAVSLGRVIRLVAASPGPRSQGVLSCGLKYHRYRMTQDDR